MEIITVTRKEKERIYNLLLEEHQILKNTLHNQFMKLILTKNYLKNYLKKP